MENVCTTFNCTEGRKKEVKKTRGFILLHRTGTC